jgi:hypothetical protein
MKAQSHAGYYDAADLCLPEANRIGWSASGRSGRPITGGISGEQAVALSRDVEELFNEQIGG